MYFLGLKYMEGKIILNGFKTYIYVLIYILKMAKNILVENVFMYIVLFYILKYI